jgi:hypothetical protein
VALVKSDPSGHDAPVTLLVDVSGQDYREGTDMSGLRTPCGVYGRQHRRFATLALSEIKQQAAIVVIILELYA